MARPPQSGVATRANEILKRLPVGVTLEGVEVGVFAGDLSQCLLEYSAHLRLWMVDSWMPAAEGSAYRESSDPHGTSSVDEHEAYFREALEKSGRFPDRATVMRMTSLDAARYFGRQLDFVFLDADHTEDSVRADLAAWSATLKPGGVMCGHDYDNAPYYGVKTAVDEWAAERGLTLDLGLDYTWFARVP